jgi:hypothetical protein
MWWFNGYRSCFCSARDFLGEKIPGICSALTVRFLQTSFIDQVFHEVRFGLKYFLTSDKHSMFILPKTSMTFMPVGSKNLTRWHTLTAARRQLVRENIAT